MDRVIDKNQTAYSMLFNLLERLDHELHEYTNTPTANQFIIKKRRELIDELSVILANINGNCFHDELHVIAKEMLRQFTVDKTLDGFNIEIKYVEQPRRVGIITLNKYLMD